MACSSLDQADLDRLLQSPKKWPNYNNYRPLNQACREIRLIELWHQNEKSEIHASIKHKSLEEEVDYDALSYYWGPPDVLKPIQIEGRPVLVRQSLYSFLDSLCHQGQKLPVWLDAICINQSDVRERNWQVAMMGDIYRRATCVKAWIGEADVDLEYAFAYLRNRKLRQVVESEHYSETVKRASHSLQQVMLRPYWQRLWIIQEIGMGRKVMVLAGGRSVELEDLISVAVDELQISIFLRSLANLRKQMNRSVPDIHAFLDLEKLYSSYAMSSRPQARWLGLRSLVSRMAEFGSHSCEDPRDKMFGLLSLCTDEPLIQVDYEKPLGDLVSELIYAQVQQCMRDNEKLGKSSSVLPLRSFLMLQVCVAKVFFTSQIPMSDLLNLTHIRDPELCCEISSLARKIPGRLTASILENRDLCEYHLWDDKSFRGFLGKSTGLDTTDTCDPTASSQDTNFYQTSSNQNPDQRTVCFCVGNYLPDPVHCRFFRILASSPSASSLGNNHDLDWIVLIVHFGERKPRIAGLSARASWWRQTFGPEEDVQSAPEMSVEAILAILLLTGEVQICSKTILAEEQDWSDGRLKARLHFSRLSCLIMPLGWHDDFTYVRVMEVLKSHRATHSQPQLCSCDFDAHDNAKARALVRGANMADIRESLKHESQKASRLIDRSLRESKSRVPRMSNAGIKTRT